MNNYKRIIFILGIFDLLAVAWYMGWNLYYGKLPVANDVKLILENASSIEIPLLAYVFIFGLIIYLSLLLSGIFFIKMQKAGAIISYFQTPFRLLMIMPPSIFFILWPLKYLFENPSIYFGIILIILSEIIKMFTVGKWHRNMVRLST